MDTPAASAVPATLGTVTEPTDVGLGGVARLPRWLVAALVVVAVAALWLVAFDNGQASAMADSTGTVLHELFHDGRHLMGAPCH